MDARSRPSRTPRGRFDDQGDLVKPFFAITPGGESSGLGLAVVYAHRDPEWRHGHRDERSGGATQSAGRLGTGVHKALLRHGYRVAEAADSIEAVEALSAATAIAVTMFMTDSISVNRPWGEKGLAT